MNMNREFTMHLDIDYYLQQYNYHFSLSKNKVKCSLRVGDRMVFFKGYLVIIKLIVDKFFFYLPNTQCHD